MGGDIHVYRRNDRARPGTHCETTRDRYRVVRHLRRRTREAKAAGVQQVRRRGPQRPYMHKTKRGSYRAVPARNRQRIQLDGEARLIIAPGERHTDMRPLARTRTRLGPDVERDLALFDWLRPT